MTIKFGHTNIITRDWKRLAAFYQSVFGCIPVPPERNHKGSWLDKGTGISNAHIEGMHFLLPGQAENGATLEIYQYSETVACEKPLPNRTGFGHIAFQTDNLIELLESALKNGGSKIGELTEHYIEGAGPIKFLYI